MTDTPSPIEAMAQAAEKFITGSPPGFVDFDGLARVHLQAYLDNETEEEIEAGARAMFIGRGGTANLWKCLPEPDKSKWFERAYLARQSMIKAAMKET